MKTLHVGMRPSRLMAAALLAIHGAAGAALAVSGLPGWAEIALILLIACNLIHQLRRHAWLSDAGAVAAFSLARNGVTLHRCDGAQLPGRLLGSSTATPYFCVLNVLPQGARFPLSVVVLPDSLDAESFRRLRVKLRWGVQRGTWVGGVSTVGSASGSVYG